MTTEFNLSEKEERCMCEAIEQAEVYQEKDVKEFIRLLKERWEEQSNFTIKYSGNPLIILDFKKEIDKIAGDKLI